MSELAADLIEGIEGFVAHLEDEGLGPDPDAVGEHLIRLRDIKDRIDRLIRDGSDSLGSAGVMRFDVDGISYKLRRSVSYKWDIPMVLEAVRTAARAQGISEIDAVATACSIASAKVRGLKALGIDPAEYRDENLGGWRIEGPRAKVDEE